MSVINMDKELFEKYAEEGTKPVLVEFWAPWCVYCRRIGAAFDSIAKQYADTLVTGKVNIDEEPELAQKEKIETIPTLTIYKDGQAIGSVVAPGSKAAIEEFIDGHLSR